MILKIFKKDFMRKKVIAIAVFSFIMLSSVLVASGTNMIIDLGNSINNLMNISDAPHFIQSHAGDIDQELIDDWSNNNSLIKLQQTSEMINVEDSNIYFNQANKSDTKSVMQNAFVKQNELFDFLLNLNNEKIILNDGEIAIPIYYMEKNDINIGDQISIKKDNFEMTFTVKEFVRDVQMNSSIISSKRFVVSDHDFETIKSSIGEIEYQISFQLHDVNDLNSFSDQYTSSNLPNKGYTIDIGLIRTVNSITDGLVAAVIILIALLLNVIALLCIRFTIISTIEEDYREIGVMKAIGITPFDIKRIYLVKYFILSFGAAIIGFILSLFVNQQFSKNIMLYIGEAPKTIIQNILPLISSMIVFSIVILFSYIILRRFDKISAIEAFRIGNTGETFKKSKKLSLYKTKNINSNIFLGLRDVLLRLKVYLLLFVVFILCTFIIIVPLNFFNTIDSPKIVTYMGMGESEVFIDLRYTDNIVERFDDIVNYIEGDSDVSKYAAFITSQYTIINSDGYEESLTVETGDFSIFPLTYMKGEAPNLGNEIALSFLVSDELGKVVGDTLEIKVNGEYKTMTVSGIYQDITNGGRTAKANIPANHETALWYTISLDVNGDVNEKISEFESQFDNVNITDTEGYLEQTFSHTVRQLKLITIVAVILSTLIAVLITSLFLQMLVAKDTSQIAIMRSIGISLNNIRIQYITRVLVVLNFGIIIGTIIANTLGEKFISLLLSIVGAANVDFIINPLESYVIIPVVLIIIVTITTIISISSIKNISIQDSYQE